MLNILMKGKEKHEIEKYSYTSMKLIVENFEDFICFFIPLQMSTDYDL